MKTILTLVSCVLGGLLPNVTFAQERRCEPTVVGTVTTVALTSRIFHNQRTLRVWLPPKFDPGISYPVLYILDGATAFDICASPRRQEIRADETLADLIG